MKTGEVLVDLVTTTQTEYLGVDMQEDQVLEGWKERLLGLELGGAVRGNSAYLKRLSGGCGAERPHECAVWTGLFL